MEEQHSSMVLYVGNFRRRRRLNRRKTKANGHIPVCVPQRDESWDVEVANKRDFVRAGGRAELSSARPARPLAEGLGRASSLLTDLEFRGRVQPLAVRVSIDRLVKTREISLV